MVPTSASRAFPGFSSVYALGEHGGSRAFRGKIPLSLVGDALDITRAEKSSAPVEVRWAMRGESPKDFVRTTSVWPILVSERVVGILRDSGLTGWQTYPIELFGKVGERIPGYHGLAVSGRCGPIDDDLSVKFPKIMPGGVFPYWRGLYFDPTTWDGSDLFMPSGSGWIFVVEAVRRAFAKANVTNVVFTALSDVERILIDRR
jgi:hypothetical protein